MYSSGCIEKYIAALCIVLLNVEFKTVHGFLYLNCSSVFVCAGVCVENLTYFE